MELLNNHLDESIRHYSSNEEVDLQPEDEEGEEEEESKNNSLGGRWYECVFCKRGFNTAQALGGHMNIHRKDRAKNNPDTTYTGPRVYPPILNGGYDPSPPPPPLVLSSNLGGTTDIGHHRPTDFPNQYCNSNYWQGSYPYGGDDWSMKVGLQLGRSSAATGMIQDYYHMEKIGEISRDHEDLDLELRLGPHP